jgi:hypothetical protein
MAKRPKTTLTVGTRTWEQYSADCWVSDDGVIAWCAHSRVTGLRVSDWWLEDVDGATANAPLGASFAEAATGLALWLNTRSQGGRTPELIARASVVALAYCNGDLPW